MLYDMINNNNNNNRLGLDLCEPHQCHCGSVVDARGLHSFVCKRAVGQAATHHAFNDLVARSFAAAWGARHKRACRVVQNRWEATGWSYTCPVAEWQTAVLGRYSDLQSGGVLCPMR